MLYDVACEILDSFPRPRVRVTLKNGEVLITPRPLLASASSKGCSISTDGIRIRRFYWSDIATFERLESVIVPGTGHG